MYKCGALGQFRSLWNPLLPAMFRAACQMVDFTAKLCWRCHRFIFHTCSNQASVFVRRALLKWKSNSDMQTDHITDFVSLPSHFSTLLVSLCFSGEKKITAVWHQVWKSLLPNSILTFNSLLSLLQCFAFGNKWKRASGGMKTSTCVELHFILILVYCH